MTRLSPAHAASLAVAGLVPLSTVDWPGKLAAVVFLQGCPWDCGYCQNPDLRDCTTAGTVTWEDVLALLRRRRGLLDGVVFSGGEATRQRALIPAIREVRELGFAVGLHTAGAYPARLADLLPLGGAGVNVLQVGIRRGQTPGRGHRLLVGGVNTAVALNGTLQALHRLPKLDGVTMLQQ